VRARGRGRRRALLLAWLVIVGLVVAGCMPAGSTVQAHQISNLYDVFLVGGLIVAGIVWSLVTWSLLRYRRRDDRLPPQTTGSLRIEAVWTAIPLATVLALFGLTVLTLGSIDAVQPGGINIRVVAFRWQWQVTYTDAGVTDTGTDQHPLELVLPVNTPIHVTLESLDVNHAFFLPAFLFKRDAIPGHQTTFDIQISEPGTYPGACAEFCGLGHDDMLFSVRAVDPAAYRSWLAARAAGASPTPPGSPGPSIGTSPSPSLSTAP
jgi:cytochrome c oxidase subunit 2